MSTIDLSSVAVTEVEDDHTDLARTLAEEMRWTGAGSRAVPFPKGLVVQQYRAGRTKGGNVAMRERLMTLLVDGTDRELSYGSPAWPLLSNEATGKALSAMAGRSYGVRFTRSETGVWVVNDTPTIPGAGLVFACDPHLGVVAAHALLECVRSERAYKEKLNIRLSMGLPA